MKENNEKLVIEGNAFYEIDMECVREKEQKKRRMQKPGRQQETGFRKAEELTSAPENAGTGQDQHPHPQPLLPHRRSRTMMIQQLSPPPQPLLHPHPLLPHRQSRMMIQRMLQQELFPKERPQPLLPQPHPLSHPQLLLLHPHPLSHPQLVAAKSLMLKSSRFSLHSII